MKISKINTIIYICVALLSILLMGLSFISPSNQWCILIGSLGTGGISALLIAIPIEIANNYNNEKKLKKTKDIICAPLVRDVMLVVCGEANILEDENEQFKKDAESKSISEIISLLESYYFDKLDIDYAVKDCVQKFDKEHESGLERRKRQSIFNGSFIQYSVDDIYNNRSFNIKNNIVTDLEIKRLIMLRNNFEKLQKSDGFYEYISNFRGFIAYINLYPENRSIFKEFYQIHKKGKKYFNQENELILGY